MATVSNLRKALNSITVSLILGRTLFEAILWDNFLFSISKSLYHHSFLPSSKSRPSLYLALNSILHSQTVIPSSLQTSPCHYFFLICIFNLSQIGPFSLVNITFRNRAMPRNSNDFLLMLVLKYGNISIGFYLCFLLLREKKMEQKMKPRFKAGYQDSYNTWYIVYCCFPSSYSEHKIQAWHFV